MIDLFDEHINRLDNLFEHDVLFNCFTSYINKSRVCKWMNTIKFDSFRFPNCVLTINQFVKLMKDINYPFPLTVYTDYYNIRILSNTTDENGLIKAHDCYLTLKNFILPIKLKMRLMYIPHASKLLKITFTSASTPTNYLMSTINANSQLNKNNKINERLIVKRIPFELVKQIVSGCKANDESYVRVWIETVKNNFD